MSENRPIGQLKLLEAVEKKLSLKRYKSIPDRGCWCPGCRFVMQLQKACAEYREFERSELNELLSAGPRVHQSELH